MVKIMIVDDNDIVARCLETIFVSNGFETMCVFSGEQALQELFTARPDIVITDVIMPGINGINLVKAIRELSDVPLIVLSVMNESEIKKLAFEAGVDDYIDKMVAMDELLPRVRVALQRTRFPVDGAFVHCIFVDADLEFDPSKREVRIGGAQKPLTPIEHALLSIFASHPEEPLSSTQLSNNVWGQDADRLDLLRGHIHHLRTKIGRQRIVTVMGFGYRYVLATE